MKDIFRLDGNIAVVIGGAGGLGQSMAAGLARQGAKVVVASRNMERLKEVVQKIQSESQTEAVAFEVDVRDEASVGRLAQNVVSTFGAVDILVNSQGVNIKKNPVEFPADDWQFLFDVNVKGTMFACREFGKIMTARKRGKIINISSVRGIRGTGNGNVGYCATKGAVDMITRSLAAEWAPAVNVNAIAPCLVMTDMVKAAVKPESIQKFLANVPLKRLGDPEDIVGACIFLSSSAADFITGHILYVDGGLTAIG